MSLSILTNSSAMQTQISLNNSSDAVSTAMQRLSSGLRINSAADDAAGYAISQGLTSQVNGLQQASQNVSDATSMVQTADSALNNVQSMLQRVSELAVQYQNGDLSSSDKSDIQGEVNQLTQEIDRQRGAVQFNGINLLDGSAGTGGAVTFQVGPSSSDTLSVSFQDIESSSNLGTSAFSWSNASTGGTVFDLSQSGAVSAISTAINNISSLAATLGAVQNRLQYTSTSISTTQENMSSSLSSIQDVNMASEMTTLTQQQVLQQAGTAMLAQANSQPQLVLKLITG
ncbi:MAG TPA: flagellin [Solirubrobacteraceae bacterium]|jgi:flagellin|nr:flagellin [Solirubrobacteraceae bacterium]